MKNKAAKEQLEQIGSRILFLRKTLSDRALALSISMEKLSERSRDCKGLNPLGEIQGSSSQIDILCAQIAELEEQAAEIGFKINEGEKEQPTRTRKPRLAD